MDFSKIKKILIILCIVSVLLNIFSKFSKVFAVDIDLPSGNSTYDFTAPEFATQDGKYWFLGLFNTSAGFSLSFSVSNSPFIIKNTYDFAVLYTQDNSSFNVYKDWTGRQQNDNELVSYLQQIENLTSSSNSTSKTSQILRAVAYNTYLTTATYLSNGVILNNNNEPIFTPEPTITYPELLNSSLTLENLSLLSYNISAGDYEDITFYALFYDRSILNTDDFWDFPQVVIELTPYNDYYWEGDTDKKYGIPITDVPLTYKASTTYSVAFAIKQYSSSGGGFRGDDWTWEFLGLPRSWTTLSSVSVNLDDLNSQTDKQNLINYQNNVTNNLNNIYGSLTGTDTTDNDNTLAQSGVITENNQDITASGFDNIFNMFYNGITANPVDIVFPIPFTQHTITIQPDYIRNALGSNNIILNLIESFWYFAVSLYIVKDIESLIRKMKNGDVATSSDTNIKADML